MNCQYETEALLLAVRDWGEADRIVTLFSPALGKVTAMAYGVRRAKNQLVGCLQPFACLDLSLSGRKNTNSMLIVRQCSLKLPLRELREDFTAMAYAALLAELTVELWPEWEPDAEAYHLLLSAFQLLTVRNPRLVVLAAAWQLLSLSGFSPECTNCVRCGQKLEFPAFFHAAAGGGVCCVCAKHNLPVFSLPLRDLLLKLLAIDLREPGQFSLSSGLVVQAEALLAEFLRCRLDRPLKAMKFIQTTIIDFAKGRKENGRDNQPGEN